MLKTFSLISDIDKANQKAQYSKRNCSATTPRTNNALVYLFISGQEKGGITDFFKINFQFNHVSYSYCNLSHMDGHLYHCFCVILIDCIGFLHAFAYFRLNRMSRSRKGLWSSGISRMHAVVKPKPNLKGWCPSVFNFSLSVLYSKCITKTFQLK